MNVRRKSCLLGHVQTRNLLEKRRMLTERKKLDALGVRLEYSTEITESRCTTDKHVKIVSSHSDEAT
jgi:hypothetical protein